MKKDSRSKHNKVMSLQEAIKKYVNNGLDISIGGFTLNRNPMAAVYEIIRQQIKDLHIYAHSNGQGVDELIGAGCVRSIEIAYSGTGRFAPTCINFSKAAESAQLIIEDYSNFQMTSRFIAGAMGVPFFPILSSLGTDIIEKWGISPDIRKNNPKLANKKLVVIDNPFLDKTKHNQDSKVVLVPAINPSVTIIHVQRADMRGTSQIDGLSFSDIEQAKASEHLIVTCEELVSEDMLRQDPSKNCIPFFYVDAVVHQPFGAYPTACYQYYDYDPEYLRNYKKIAKDGSINDHFENYVFSFKDFNQMLDMIGAEHLQKIRAISPYGYAKNLDRSN